MKPGIETREYRLTLNFFRSSDPSIFHSSSQIIRLSSFTSSYQWSDMVGIADGINIASEARRVVNCPIFTLRVGFLEIL